MNKPSVSAGVVAGVALGAAGAWCGRRRCSWLPVCRLREPVMGWRV